MKEGDSELHDEINCKLEIVIEPKSKCGEVFVTKTGQISCFCVICQQNYENFLIFSNHVLEEHLGLDLTAFNELKIDKNHTIQIKNLNGNNNFMDIEKNHFYNIENGCSYESIKSKSDVGKQSNCSKLLNNFNIKLNALNYEDKIVENIAIESTEGLDFKSKLCNINVPIPTEWIDSKNLDVKSYSLDKCQRNFSEEDILEKNKKNHKRKSIDCPHCGNFFGFSLFKSHDLKLCSKNHKKYWSNNVDCLKNNNSYCLGEIAPMQLGNWVTDQVLEAETENAENVEIYNCKQCFKSFNNQSILKKHEKNHGIKVCICEICSKEFLSKKEYEEHLKCFHRNLVENKAKFKRCRFCSMAFQKLINLEKHEERHKNVQICEYCGKLFENQKAKYQQHLRSHTGEKPFNCSICPNAFSTRGNLNHHKSTCHSEERPYICTWLNCGKGFKKDRQRVWHERIHTGEKPYQCEQCGEHFAFQHKLSLHKKQKHLDKKDRPHKCDQCEKAFVLPRQLREHKYTHTGEKPHQCDICPARFAKRGALTEHKKLHTGEKKHVCEICGRAFAQRAGYATHKKSHSFV